MEDADCDLRDADYWSKPRRFPMCAAAAVGRRSLSQFPFPGVVEQASGKSRSAKCRHLGIPGSGTRFQAQWPCCRLLVPPLALCPPYDIAPQTPGWGLALPSSVPPPIDNPKPGSSAPCPQLFPARVWPHQWACHPIPRTRSPNEPPSHFARRQTGPTRCLHAADSWRR